MTRETTVVAEALLRSLFDRADTLRLYLRELQGHNSEADSALGRALDMFVSYTRAIAKQAQGEWEAYKNPNSRVRNMRALLNHLLEQETIVDERFGRAGQTRVPHALVSLIRVQSKSLGLENVEPVVTVGPPADFEVVHNIHDLLFNDLYYAQDHFPPPRIVSLLTVPYLEGTRAAWRPLVVGHELAHLKVVANSFDIFYNRLQLRKWVDGATIAAAGPLPETFYQTASTQSELGPKPAFDALLERWATEVLCDLNALRLYGAAAVASHGEFLEVIGATSTTTFSHPPGGVRARLMLAGLKDLDPINRAIVAPWQALAESETSEERWVHTLAAVLWDHKEQLFDEVKSWGDVYEPRRRGECIRMLAARLIAGIPGDTAFPSHDYAVTDPDVVNATWLARQLEEWREVDEDAPDMSTISLRSSGIPIDRLASKAIENIEFTTLWREESDTEPTRRLPAISNGSEPGMLSGAELNRRLQQEFASPEALIVTPLMDDAVREAGLDVRLSTGFITFKHSSTPAFDALLNQAPRTMHQLVEKAWGDTFVLHPRELVLAATLEYIVMPGDLVAHVVTRSSYGRLGLITATAVQVQPFSRGCITLELVNEGEMPLTLTPGERIAQLVFHRLSPAVKAPIEQKYRYPTGPEFSKVARDPEVKTLTRIRQRFLALRLGKSSLSATEEHERLE